MITATAIFKFKRVKTLWSFNKYFSVNHFKHQFQTDHKNVKDFYDIPGPKSYPVVGTLYKYFPFFGE